MVPFDCTFWGELDFHMVPLALVKTRCSLLCLLSFGVYAVYFSVQLEQAPGIRLL